VKPSHRIVLAFFVFLCSVAPALADSDGFYCTGRGYIAFDLRSFIHPDLKEPHLLRLYRFDSERGIFKAAEWAMKDFQIHTMRCTRDRIEVAGSGDARYVFDTPAEKGKKDDADSSLEGQLGWSTPRVKTLESDDSEHTYKLTVSVLTKGSETTWKAEQLQMDSQQKVVQRVLLYERQSEENGE